MIRWCENSLGDPSVATHSGSYDRWKFPPFLKAIENPVAQPSCAMLYKDTVQSIRYPEGSLVEGHNSLLSDTMTITKNISMVMILEFHTYYTVAAMGFSLLVKLSLLIIMLSGYLASLKLFFDSM